MIYFLLPKKSKQSLDSIINWIRKNIQKNNFEYSLMFCSEYLFDISLIGIKEDDFLFWHSDIAKGNLSYVTEYKNSIVILEHQTNLNEKISNHNPINENQAINYGFHIMYLDEEIKITQDWKLAVQNDTYLLKQQDILTILSNNKDNYKKEFVEHQDIFDDLISFTKQQVNF